MAGFKYEDPSPEVYGAIAPCVAEIAVHMGVHPSYLYSILAGEKPDSFSRTKRLFRSIAKKNPEGARGILASLQTIFNDEQPPVGASPNGYEASRTWADLIGVAVEYDEGLCSIEKLEAAKQRHVDAVLVGWLRHRQGTNAGD